MSSDVEKHRPLRLVIDKNIGPLLRIADTHFILEKGRTVWNGSSASLLAAKDVLKETLGV